VRDFVSHGYIQGRLMYQAITRGPFDLKREGIDLCEADALRVPSSHPFICPNQFTGYGIGFEHLAFS